MSQIKKFNLGLIIIFVMMSFFMFGCEKSTPVNDIHFNLDEGKQIVLMVGQTLEMKDRISITPSYATNQKYSITSYDENVAKIEDNCLVAISEGATQIRVVSDDNPLKEDLMTVVVKKTKTQLISPLNLVYDNSTQSFAFDAVAYASSYTFKVNGIEYDLGNSTVFNLSQHKDGVQDELLVVQVRANAPSYTYALESSEYSNEYKVYQAGKPENVKIENGVLSFTKTSSAVNINIYLSNELFVENTKEVNISLKNLDEDYVGKTTQVGIEAVVSDETKEKLGEDVLYFNSAQQILELNVLDSVDAMFSAGMISWKNVAYSSGYAIYVDNVLRGETQNNYFELSTLNNYDEILTVGESHNVKIEPLIGENSTNVGKSTKENIVLVQRLNSTIVTCNGRLLVWDEIENASHYAVTLTKNGTSVKTSVLSPSFDLTGYEAGDYSVFVQAIGGTINRAEQECYLLPSLVANLEFNKLEKVEALINDCKLEVIDLNNDTCLIETDIAELDNEQIEGTNETIEINLLTYVLSAGKHSISLTRNKDGNYIQSDATVLNFTQLEKIAEIAMNDGVASVERSSINEMATIRFVTSGTCLSSDIQTNGTMVKFNTTNSSENDYLSAGTYTTSVYVYGDESSTFSYRESGNIVKCATVQFEVLSVPTVVISDTSKAELNIGEVANANSYSIYKTDEETPSYWKEVTNQSCQFELNSGKLEFSVQARGDGKQYLNSALSETISVTRLNLPTLSFNNQTQILSKQDNNDTNLIRDYILTGNGVNLDYDFSSVLDLNEDIDFVLILQAINGSNGIYYLNSLPCELNLKKISNTANVYLNEFNSLIIEPSGHIEQYDLIMKFDLGGGVELNFKSNNSVLSGDKYNLNLEYEEGVYAIQLIESYNAIIEEMNDNFTVEIQFVKPSTGNDFMINSETISKDLSLIHVDNRTTITINENNQIVITPTSLSQEYGLIVVINDDEDFTFTSNGSELVSNEITLPYSYKEDTLSYYINIIDESYNYLHEVFSEDFTIKLKYTNLINSSETTDLDSYFTENVIIKVQQISILTREGQTLKFTKANSTDTFASYALFVTNKSNNQEFTINISKDMVTIYDGYFTMDIKYIYENVETANLTDIYSVSVVTLNQIDSSVANIANKSEELLIQKAQTPEIKFNKDNEQSNNSVVVSLETMSTEYDSKEYVFEIYNADFENKILKTYIDADTSTGVLAFNLDDIDIDGTIYIRAYIDTTDDYVNQGVIYVFNSDYSNELEFTEIATVQNLTVSNSIITFDEVENAVGYEVYSNGEKLNDDLLTINEYEIKTSGTKEIVVKAISKADGYSNSNFSESITVNKLESPTINVENGKFKINLPSTTLTLMTTENISVIPEIKNKEQIVKLDIDSIDVGSFDLMTGRINGSLLSGDIKYSINVFTGTATLICEPYLFLSYNSASMIKEDLSVQIRVEYSEPIDDVYYLNSDIVPVVAHGLFEPINIRKTTDGDGAIETLVWEANTSKNILNDGASVGTVPNVGYVFKIEHNSKDNTYYSNDLNLKYYDENSKTYKSYPSQITTTNAIFPAGYDEDGDGELDVEFGEGVYKVYVQTVPTGTIVGYNIFSSRYSNAFTFEILKQPKLIVENGKVVWEKLANATGYQVSIYENNETEAILIDSTTEAEFDFTKPILNSGVLKVVVKALGGSSKDILNSKESEPIYVYKLPEATAVSVDDGHLILSSTAFFSKAKIEFVDTDKTIYEEVYDNSTIANQKLSDLNIEDFSEFTNDSAINTNIKTAIKLDSQLINILSGRDYTINVTLIGNSNTEQGFVNSTKKIDISSMTATKLKANVNKIGLGTLKFLPDSNYATITGNSYTDALDMNYLFNAGTTSTNENFKQFWNNTMLYKIKITHLSGETNVYAVDYFSFITAFDVSQTSNEYEILDHKEDTLYAVVKYPYNGGTLYFNVYKDNIINLKEYDVLSYYEISEELAGGQNVFTSNATMKTLVLTDGGSFSFDISILGGDSYSKDGRTIGYLNSSPSQTQTFIRYGLNELSTLNGKLKFNDLLPKVYDEKTEEYHIVDYPVYKIDLQGYKTFYLYYDVDSSSLENAKLAANDSAGEFVSVETQQGLDGILFFDLSQYVSSGKYSATIRTLAGLGTTPAQSNYLLSGKASNSQPIYKLSDTTMSAKNGLLTFDQSYYSVDTTKIYSDNYEITIIGNNGEEYVFEIDRNSEGVSINDTTHIVTYFLPAQFADFTISTKTDYQIKVRSMSIINPVINGTYAKVNSSEDAEDVTLTFSKAEGVKNVRIENGILSWENAEGNESVVIKVTFLDENSKEKNIYIPTSGTSYEFSDDIYSFDTTGEDYMSGGKYNISIYVIGSTIDNVLNSDYSSPIVAERLNKVDSETIKTENGVLVWNAVDNAESYEITIKDDSGSYLATSDTNSLDIATQVALPVGTYSVTIRAIGSGYIHAIASSEIDGFVQLGSVDKNTIEFEGTNIKWDAVENAQGYNVVLMVKNLGIWEEVENSLQETNSYTAPAGFVGEFKILITPVGVGTGKLFNGKTLDDYTSSTAVPAPVQALVYDEENQRFEITVNNQDFNESDHIEISYILSRYTISDINSDLPSGNQEQVTDTIAWINNTTTYYYPLSIMGQYSSIAVRVVRPNVWPSDAVEHDAVELRLFGFGAGTFDDASTQDINEANPYMIYNAEQLLNIKHFPSANYELAQSIDMSNVNIQERLNENEGGIISKEFSGALNGKNSSIYRFNKIDKVDTISLTNAESFALFGTLNGATIKNLTIGEENVELILSNTIAKDSPNMIKLSLIATGADTSTIENVNLLNCKMEVLSTSATKYSKPISVSGLINEMTNTTISSSEVNLSVNIDMGLDTDCAVKVGGVACYAETSNIVDSIIGISLETTASIVFDSVGGAIAEFVGNSSKTNVVSNTTVNFTSNVKSTHIGGLVGYANYININSCEISGEYIQQNMKYMTYIGGVVGFVENSTIQSSGSFIEFDLSIGTNNNQNIGSIVGYSSKSVIEECYSHYYDTSRDQTEIDGATVNIGIYGDVNETSISDFKYKNKE